MDLAKNFNFIATVFIVVLFLLFYASIRDWQNQVVYQTMLGFFSLSAFAYIILPIKVIMSKPEIVTHCLKH